MMTGTVIKAIGIGATVIGMGVEFVNDWVSEKKMEEKIEEKVNEAFAKRENKEEES